MPPSSAPRPHTSLQPADITTQCACSNYKSPAREAEQAQTNQAAGARPGVESQIAFLLDPAVSSHLRTHTNARTHAHAQQVMAAAQIPTTDNYLSVKDERLLFCTRLFRGFCDFLHISTATRVKLRCMSIQLQMAYNEVLFVIAY